MKPYFRRGIQGVFLFIILLFLLSIAPSPTQAATVTWDDGSGDGLWSTAINWSGDVLPAPGDDVVFDDTSTNCTADVVTNNLGSITLSATHTATVTFAANAVTGGMSMTLSGDITVDGGNLVFQGDTTATNGGTPANPYGIGYDISASNITIASGASINADYMGFLGTLNGDGKGPGGGEYFKYGGGGGGYGGRGGIGSDKQEGGITYGTSTNPTALGSGAGGYNSAIGAGGGAIKLTVTNAVTVNGQLSANGEDAVINWNGGGAGGSLWIDSGTLAGTGTISANGGSTAWPEGGGGGGRIDISECTNNFHGIISAEGGTGTELGRTGTILVPQSAGTGLTLNNFIVTNNLSLSAGTYNFGNLVVSNSATLTLDGNPNATNAVSGGTISNLHGEGVIINATNIEVKAGSSISADALGFYLGGPGMPASGNSGASYGGIGERYLTDPICYVYGSDSTPTALGSSAFTSTGNGGGAIKLNIVSNLIISGTITANGAATGNNGASGGSIWLICNSLSGTSGAISANGANRTRDGGGGRIRIEYFTNTYSGTITAASGGAGAETGSVILVDTSIAQSKPEPPSLLYPPDSASLDHTTTYLQISAVDTNYDYLRFKIEISTNSGFSVIAQTIDQTSSQVGWHQQTAQGSTAYDAEDTATHLMQTPLIASTVHYWRAYAIDPDGLNTWSISSSTQSFTSGNAPASFWDNDSSDGLWSTATNWSGNSVPATNANVIFSDLFSTDSCTSDLGTNGITIASLMLSNDYTGTLTFERADTNGPGSLTITDDLIVNGGNIVCNGNADAPNSAAGGTDSKPYGEGITISASNITIASDVSINADYMGFPMASGPGRGFSVINEGASGGSYGGKGGRSSWFRNAQPSNAYGNASSPTALGSGGGGTAYWGGSKADGGGAIKLTLSGILNCNGRLSVDGNVNSGATGGGSGGSIWITSGTITGTGTISAEGGDIPGGSGGGGGGRIDISGCTNNFHGTISSQGGSSSQAGRGRTGTILFPQSTGTGLILDNLTVTNDLWLRSGTYNFGTLIVSNGATLTLDGAPETVNANSGGTTNNTHGIGVTINVTNVDIVSGSTISMNSCGFYKGYGPGQPSSGNSGASYVGLGEQNASDPLGTIYGSATEPTALGSSSDQSTGQSSGYGGGALKLNVSSNLIVAGTISANAQDAGNNGAAGGSIWLICNTLSGNGAISVDGADRSRDGSGGRIRIEYMTNSYGGTTSASGGGGGAEDGQVIMVDVSSQIPPYPPTLTYPADSAALDSTTPYFLFSAIDTNQDYIRYKVEIATDADFTNIVQTFDQTSSQSGYYQQTEQGYTAYASSNTATLVINTPLSAGTLHYWRAYAIDPGTTNGWSSSSVTQSFTTGSMPLNYWANHSADGLWATATNWSKGTVPISSDDILFLGALSDTDCTVDTGVGGVTVASITMASDFNSSLITKRDDNAAPGVLNVVNDIVLNSGNLVCQGNQTATNTTAGGSSGSLYGEGILIAASNVTIASGATINADGTGFSNKKGPGHGNTYVNEGASGGSYGGRGGTSSPFRDTQPENTYSYVVQPTALGSCGGLLTSWGMTGVEGGGAIKLAVSNSLTCYGTVSANGKTGTGAAGGGSGGSVWIITDTISGSSGVISANGGAGVSANMGGGGGGRIFVEYTTNNSTNLFALETNIQTYGGWGYQYGGSGTIVVKHESQTYGDFISDNDGHNSAVTDIRTNSFSGGPPTITFDNLTIRNGTKLIVQTNMNIAVNGDFLNSNATVLAYSNSTVTLISTNQATVSGSNDFWNLTSIISGKRIDFVAGSTNNVAGMLTLQYVQLYSTLNGSYWYLNVSGTQDVANVSVHDSNANDGQTIMAYYSLRKSWDNPNWDFIGVGTVISVH